ncbi:MAG: hypothetical protein P4L27_14685 [Ignavibacteriaceae bacterium]|nr:hypothetical protein [Ignavibacteriaceae bacterium]
MKKPIILLFIIITIQFFFGCSHNSKSPESLLASFRENLEKLHKSDLSSISQALDNYRNNFSNVTPEIKDSAFIDYRGFFYDVINSYYQIFWNNQNLVNKLNSNKNDDPEVLQLKKELDKNGLRLSKTEGGYYIDEQPNFLYNNFKDYVTQSIKEFLLIRSKELDEGFSENSKLLISFKSLGDRIVTWENYLNKFPASPLSAEAKFSYHLYLNTFITGLDNSPVAIDENLLPEIKNVYSDYIRENKNTESGKIVEKFYSIVSKNNFHLTTDLDDFYEENQIESMKGMEPPTR